MKSVLILPFMLWCFLVSGQKIADVSQQSIGGKIIITYSIQEARPEQVFDVAVYSSHDKFAKALASVSGNGVGEQVKGGLHRTIIWNVLNDLPEFVGTYNFEVRALVHEHAAQGDQLALSRTLRIADKDAAYPEMSNTITNYINEAKDLKDAFQFISKQSFESRQALNALALAQDQYNAAFEKLNNARQSYEKYVTDFWKRDVLELEFKSLMDYTLGDVHSVDILTLSQRIEVINNLYQGQIKSQKKANEAKAELSRSIQMDVARLEKRLQELERRSNRMLYNLSQEN